MAEAHPDFPARALQQEGPVEREGDRGSRGIRGERGERGFGCIGTMLFHRIAVMRSGGAHLR